MIPANKKLMPIEKVRKRLDRVQTALLFVFAVPIGWAVWQYQRDLMTKNEATLWFAVSFFPMAVIDALFSIKRGTSWAKGVKISRESTPDLFLVNVAVSIVLAGLCLFYAFWYFT